MITVRTARPGDAVEIARLANLPGRHEGLADDLFTEELVLRDGFGGKPAFQVLIAGLDGKAVGYALFTDGYNTEIPARAVWLDDIFVDEPARGRGIGRHLLAAIARTAVERSARSVWWGVRSTNQRARAFYARLGAKDDNARILGLNDAALMALAAECRDPTTGMHGAPDRQTGPDARGTPRASVRHQPERQLSMFSGVQTSSPV